MALTLCLLNVDGFWLPESNVSILWCRAYSVSFCWAKAQVFITFYPRPQGRGNFHIRSLLV